MQFETRDKLIIITWNFNGLVNKTRKLKKLLLRQHMNMASINEIKERIKEGVGDSGKWRTKTEK